MKLPLMELSRTLTATKFRVELVKIQKYRCKHGHTGLSHYNCYRTEQGQPERIGFLDTEFYVGRNNWGKLAGDWGTVLCWVIGDEKGNIVFDSITPKEILQPTQDKRIITSCIQELSKYDRIVHHYGDACDLPLLRTRALYHGLEFPTYGQLKTEDVWKIAKAKLCLSSNSQKNLSYLLRGKSEKTEVIASIWLAAIRGDKKALDCILAHCKVDVRELTKNYVVLKDFIQKGNRSI